eukprot:Hpha_TRINITY_DN35795_c0_g1::TRINITY_DN35795_c0_g1_i1::g.139863::m.139863
MDPSDEEAVKFAARASAELEGADKEKLRSLLQYAVHLLSARDTIPAPSPPDTETNHELARLMGLDLVLKHQRHACISANLLLGELQPELSRLSSRNAELESENAKLREEVQKLEQKNQALRTEMRSHLLSNAPPILQTAQ